MAVVCTAIFNFLVFSDRLREFKCLYQFAIGVVHTDSLVEKIEVYELAECVEHTVPEPCCHLHVSFQSKRSTVDDVHSVVGSVVRQIVVVVAQEDFVVIVRHTRRT
jgi:hypothetical protein